MSETLESFSPATIGLRALVDLAESLDVSRESAEGVAESAEAVERLQALRDELKGVRHEAGELGLQGPSLVTIEVLSSERSLEALLADVAEMVRVHRERLEALDELDRVRRDAAALHYRWLVADNRYDHAEALEAMAEIVRRAFGLERPKAMELHELMRPTR